MRIELPTPFPNGILPRLQDDAPPLTLPPHWLAGGEAWLDVPQPAVCSVGADTSGPTLTLTL